MAGKASFLLYTEDLIDLGKLTDKEAGQLLKAIVEYQTTGVLPEKLPVRADIMFGYIRRSLDKNREKYEKTCKARAEAGKKGGRPKKSEEDAPSDDAEEKQNKANKANAFFALSEKAKKPDHEHDHEHEHDHDHVHEYNISLSSSEGLYNPEVYPEPAADDEKRKRIMFLKTMINMYGNGDVYDQTIRSEYEEELVQLQKEE